MKGFIRQLNLALCIVFLYAFDVSAASRSFWGIDYSFHTAQEDNTHQAKGLSYGTLFQSETQAQNLRLALGLSVRYSDQTLTVDGQNFSIINMNAHVRAGLVIDIFNRSSFRPIFGAYGLGGGELITTASPPTGASESQFAPGWGYEVEGGLSLGGGRRPSDKTLRLLVAYRNYRYNYGGQSIRADAWAGRVGFTF